MVTLAPETQQVQVAWSTQVTGVFTVGTSAVGGTDVVQGTFGNNTFNDVTTDVKSLTFKRGKTTALASVEAGTCTIVLNDQTGKYNPQNPASTIYPNVVPMRPVKVSTSWVDYTTTVLNDSPAGYWHLGEAQGSSSATDSSGNGNTGTYTGGTTLGQTGALAGDTNTAVLFDGLTGYVAVPNSTSLNPGDTISVEFLVKRKDANVTSVEGLRVLNKGASTGGYDVYWHNNLLYFSVNGVADIGRLGTTIVDANWHHVVFTKTGSTFHAYLDNVESTVTISPATVVASNTKALAIGAISASDGGGDWWNGYLDEMAVYPTVLSAARVTSHYLAYLAAVGGDLKAFPRFNGYIRRITHDPNRNVKETTVECVDFFLWVSKTKPVVASLGATTVDVALGKVLDALGLTQTGLRSFDVGSAIPDFSADGTKTALTLFQDLLTADLGFVFVDASGVIHYKNRTSRWGSQVAIVDSFTSAVITDTLPSTDVDVVVNRQSVTRTGGAPQSATDASSSGMYGFIDGQAVTTPYLNTDTNAASLAAFLVQLQKNPNPPTSTVGLWNQDAASITKQLRRELGDMVTVSETLGGTVVTGPISGLVTVIDQAGKRELTKYMVAKRVMTMFTVGYSTVGSSDQIGY